MAAEFVELAVPTRLRVPETAGIGDVVHQHILAGFSVEAHHDGVRCQALFSGSCWSFAGTTPTSAGRAEYRNIPDRCPNVVSNLDEADLPVGTLLDGKLIADSGRNAVLARMTCAMDKFGNLPPERLRLVVLDMIDFGEDALDPWPLKERRRLLLNMLQPADSLLAPDAQFGDDGLDWALRLLHNPPESPVAGVALRRTSAPYSGGRTRDWLTYKHAEAEKAVIMQVLEGRGRLRGMAGCLVLGQYFGGSLRQVAIIDKMETPVRHYLWTARDRLIGTVVSFISAAGAKGSRQPKLRRFLPNVDPASCRRDELT